MVQSWEAYESVLSHTFESELRCDPREYNILLTEAPSNAETNRNKMFDILFEKFDPKGAQCQVQAVLALYASGRTTGNVLDSGDGVTHTVPVFKGYGNRTAVQAVRNAGRNVTKVLITCLNKYHDINLSGESNGIEIARDVKEKCCRVALDYDSEMAEIKQDATKKVSYEFKDGRIIDLGESVIEPAESLFNPRVTGLQVAGIKEMLEATIQGCNMQVRAEMYKNTVLSGGTSCIPGFSDRVLKEFKQVVPPNAQDQIKINAPSDRKFAVFNGGSILSCLSSFQSKWVTRDEYAEKGHEACHAKSLF